LTEANSCTHQSIEIKDAPIEYFEGVVRQDNLKIDMNVPQQLENLNEYVEGWKKKIWNQEFHSYFKGGNYLKKGTLS